jgi:Ca2+-binding EF-hand superfamily protein
VVVNAYAELFERMDSDRDGYLNKAEMDQYMMRTEGAPVQNAAYQWLLHKFESKEGAFLYLLRTVAALQSTLRSSFR